MELQTFDFELSLKSIENFVQVVVWGQDENKKIRLRKKLNHFLQITNNHSNITRKRPSNLNFEVSQKKIKPESEGKVKIPNEIWTKIMNYLPTSDIFNNFGLVNKRFQSLIGAVKYLKVNLKRVRMNNDVFEVVKNSKTLIELDLNIQFDTYCATEGDLRQFTRFVNQAVKLCQRLKSLKIKGFCRINFALIEILRQFGNYFEHLKLERLRTTPEVLIEISKLKSLKSLALLDLDSWPIKRYEAINPQVVCALATNSTQLESIDFQYDSSNDFALSEAFNKLFSERKDTLKKVGLVNKSRLEHYKNLSICKNLVELRSSMLASEILLSKELATFFQINCIKLEHLHLVLKEEYFDQLATLQFTALKFLMVCFAGSFQYVTLNQKSLITLVKNSPNLKALKIAGKGISFSFKFLSKIFDSYGTIIIAPNPGANMNYLKRFDKDSKHYQEYQKYQKKFSELYHE